MREEAVFITTIVQDPLTVDSPAYAQSTPFGEYATAKIFVGCDPAGRIGRKECVVVRGGSFIGLFRHLAHAFHFSCCAFSSASESALRLFLAAAME